MKLSAFIFAAIAILAIVLGPLCVIWALNTLFPVLAIPYALDTWCAVIIVSSLFTVNVKANK